MDEWFLPQQLALAGSPLSLLPIFAGKMSEGYASSISFDDKHSIHIWIIQHCLFHNQGLVLLLDSKLGSLLTKEIAAQAIFQKPPEYN